MCRFGSAAQSFLEGRDMIGTVRLISEWCSKQLWCRGSVDLPSIVWNRYREDGHDVFFFVLIHFQTGASLRSSEGVHLLRMKAALLNMVVTSSPGATLRFEMAEQKT